MKMPRVCWFLICFWICCHVGFAQDIIFDPPLSTRIASYDIDVVLDVERKMLQGKEVLYWKNTSPDTIREIQFHLYYNAFKNTRSSFYKDAGGSRSMVNVDLENEDIWGWVNIDRITDGNGNDLSASQRFLHPDDGNEKTEMYINC